MQLLTALTLVSLMLFVITFLVSADTKTLTTKISGTNVTLYAENSAYKYDNSYGGCLWISRSSPWVTSYKQVDPTSCVARCGVDGFIFNTVTGARGESSGYVSLSKTVRYNDTRCAYQPMREIESEAKHGIYHDYGVW